MSRRRLTRAVISIVVITAVSILGYSFNQDGTLGVPSMDAAVPPGYNKVVGVNDGDTIKVQVAGKTETVRLLGIDTPEVKDPRKAVQCYGKQASAKTHELVDGKSVRLESDPINSDRDKYGRLLRYVYLPDGTMLNQYLVENGYAFAYTVFPFTKIDQFRELESAARQHNKGLWIGCTVKQDGDAKRTNDA